MNYNKKNNMDNNLKELNKLEEQIKETQQLLEKSETNDLEMSSLKIQRNIFGILMLLFLGAFAFMFIYKSNGVTNNMMDDKNLSLINNDSLIIYKKGYFNSINNSKANSISNEKVIYSVQIGAFKDFFLTSDSLMNLSEFNTDGYNKFSIGNYKTYAEAKALKDNLIKLGFKDCFLSAKSFGKPIDIREALALSNELEFLEQ